MSLNSALFARGASVLGCSLVVPLTNCVSPDFCQTSAARVKFWQVHLVKSGSALSGHVNQFWAIQRMSQLELARPQIG